MAELLVGLLAVIGLAAIIVHGVTARHEVEAEKRLRQRLDIAREAEATRRYVRAHMPLD